MKFNSISIFLFLIDVVHGKQGPLSVKENLSRLQTCGKVDKNEYPRPWLWSVGFTKGASTYFGTFISSRHFLTSSILFLKDDKPKEFQKSNCVGNEIGIRLPRSYEFNLTQPSFRQLRRSKQIILPMFCTGHINHVIEEHYSPMIVEFLKEQTSTFPCLGAANSSEADYWFLKGGFRRKTIPFEATAPRNLLNDSILFQYGSYIPEFYLTDQQQSIPGDKEKEIGGVLEQTIDGKFTMIGIKTSGDWTRYGTHIFFRMEWLEDDICKLTGVCTKGLVKPEPRSSTESATTSGSMETSGVPESSDPLMTLEPSTATAGTLETSVNPITSENPGTGTSPEVATTVLPLAVPHQKTMPPEYVDHGDYDMIFDSLYEFPEFREIEETPYEKKGCQKSFELVLVVLFMIFFL